MDFPSHMAKSIDLTLPLTPSGICHNNLEQQNIFGQWVVNNVDCNLETLIEKRYIPVGIC